MRFGQNVYGYYQRLLKKLLEQLGLRRYAVNTHQDQFVPEPPLKILDPHMKKIQKFLSWLTVETSFCLGVCCLLNPLHD